MNKKAKEMRRIRNKADKTWREVVKLRDGNKCVINEDCSKGHVNVHHIIPREIKGYRHNVDNGICLCPSHHKYSFKISAHKNPLMFFMWLIENKHEQFSRLWVGLK